MGFDAKQAAGLKRFIRACMQAEEAGEYDEKESAEGADLGDMGALQ